MHESLPRRPKNQGQVNTYSCSSEKIRFSGDTVQQYRLGKSYESGHRRFKVEHQKSLLVVREKAFLEGSFRCLFFTGPFENDRRVLSNYLI